MVKLSFYSLLPQRLSLSSPARGTLARTHVLGQREFEPKSPNRLLLIVVSGGQR